MRPLVLASAVLLILSGCAAPEPLAEPTEIASVQVQTAEPTETAAEVERTTEPELSPEAETTEEATETDSESQAERTQEPEATESDEADQATGQEAEREAEAEASPSPTATATQTQAPEPDVVGYTLAEVSLRNTRAECWVAISGNVYNLTQWIGEHPGGEERISRLCGKDGTSQFLSMHGGQSDAEAELQSNFIGPLR